MKKAIIWILLVLVVLAGGVYFYKSKNNYKNDEYVEQPVMVDNSQDNTSNSTQNTVVKDNTSSSNTSTNTTKSAGITASGVATHNSKSSCWSIISGKVYDLTPMFGKHPGGDDAILAICGKDGSDLFSAQHGMSQKVLDLLPNFYLGILAN